MKVRIEFDAFGFESKDDTNKFAGKMRTSDNVSFTLADFLVIIFGKNSVVTNKRHTTIQNSISEMRRTMFDHFGGVFGSTGLEMPRFKPGESKHFVRRIKPVEVAELGNDDGGGVSTDTFKRDMR